MPWLSCSHRGSHSHTKDGVIRIESVSNPVFAELQCRARGLSEAVLPVGRIRRAAPNSSRPYTSAARATTTGARPRGRLGTRLLSGSGRGGGTAQAGGANGIDRARGKVDHSLLT